MFRKSIINKLGLFNNIHSSRSLDINKILFSNLKFGKEYNYDQRYKEVANITVRQAIAKCGIKSTKDWINVKQEIFDTSRNISPVNIDFTLLNYCIFIKNYELAENYLKYLKEEGIKLNLATIGKLFKFYYIQYIENVSTKNDDIIFNMYTDLIKEYGVLDSISSENAIEALSITKHWEICLELLKDIKVSSTPTIAAYSCTIAAAFKNNHSDIAWNLLTEMIEQQRTPLNITYLAFLNKFEEHISKGDKNIKYLEELLNFLSYNDIIVNEEISNKITQVLKLLNINCTSTTISPNASCLQCKNILPKIDLTETEFEMLKTAFFEKVIVGKDVFRKTTPAELEEFKIFVKQKSDYDVVIDGLNVAYSAGVKKPPHITAKFVASVVKHFANQNKKILVLGRKHMNRWPKEHIYYIKRNAQLFLTQSLSQDDPYLLYCGLNAGKNTIIVTRDLMRSHLYLLKDVEQKKIFSRWLTQSQHHLIKVLDNGRVLFKTPSAYVKTAQKINNTWHVPFSNSNSNIDELNWLCIKL